MNLVNLVNSKLSVELINLPSVSVSASSLSVFISLHGSSLLSSLISRMFLTRKGFDDSMTTASSSPLNRLSPLSVLPKYSVSSVLGIFSCESRIQR